MKIDRMSGQNAGVAERRVMVIIPAFNEEAALGSLIPKARARCPRCDLVVVDDGSTDDTLKIAYAAKVIVLRHPVNLGYGASLQTGIEYALRRGYSTVAFLDADGKHEPEDLEKLLAPVVSGQCDVAIGSRFLDPGSYRHGVFRKFGSWAFSRLVRLLTSIPVTDPTSGARALNRRAMRLYTREGFPDEFPDVSAIVLYHRYGLRVCEVPVRMYPSVKKRPMHRGMTVPYYIFNVFFSILIALLQEGTPAKEE